MWKGTIAHGQDQFSDSSWKDMEIQKQYLMDRFEETQAEKEQPSNPVEETPTPGQVTCIGGSHPRYKIHLPQGSHTIVASGGMVNLLHLPSRLPGLSAPKMVCAYRQVLFGNDHKLRRLKRSVWYMHPEVFSGLPDLVLEAIIGQPPRLVFLERFTPTSMGHYRHSLEELIHPFLFFACAILSRKWLRPEDRQRTKKRLDEKRWK